MFFGILSRMDIQDTRIRNTRYLAKTRSDKGTIADLCRTFALNYHYIYQVCDKRRNFTEKTARQVEAAVGVPVGWLDIDHSSETNTPQVAPGEPGRSPRLSMILDGDYMQGSGGVYIQNGATVIYDTAVTPKAGNVVVADKSGQLIVGNYSKFGDSARLKPSNIEYPATQIEHADIAGVVVSFTVRLI